MRSQKWSKKKNKRQVKIFFEKEYKTKRNKRNGTEKDFCGEQQKDEQERGKEKKSKIIETKGETKKISEKKRTEKNHTKGVASFEKCVQK